MSAVTPAPLRCPEARELVSARLDGIAVGPEVEAHLRTCPACTQFEDTSLAVRRVLRGPEVLVDDEAPVVPPITPPARRRPRAVAILVALALFVASAGIGYATVRWRGGTPPAVAEDRSSVVTNGQVLVHSLAARVTLTEATTGRQADGSLNFVAPEAVALRLAEGSASIEVGVNGETAWLTGPTADAGTAVTGREPFDPAGWSALELIVPVGAFGGDPGRVVATDLGSRPAWQISTSVAQVSELLGAFRTGLDWQPLHPSDPVTLWLDRTSGVPLRVEVAAGAFTVALDDVVLNGGDPAEIVPPRSLAPRDVGFVDRGLSAAELPEPGWLPAAMAPYRSGQRPDQGAAGDVVERTWTNGRSWVKVTGTRSWTGSTLFGDLGPLVRPLDDGTGPVYRSEDGRAVALHGAGIDVVITGSVGEDGLVRVARSLGITPRGVPDSWPEARARDVSQLANLGIRVLVPPLATDGRTGTVLDRGTTVEVSMTGPGPRGARLVQSEGDRLAPVEDPDARAVTVRGFPGRFSPNLDELTWLEDGRVLVLSTHTLGLADLLSVADSLVWSGP